MNTEIRTSQLARSIASALDILPAQALLLVQAAKSELEMHYSLLSLREAGEVEGLVFRNLKA